MQTALFWPSLTWNCTRRFPYEDGLTLANAYPSIPKVSIYSTDSSGAPRSSLYVLTHPSGFNDPERFDAAGINTFTAPKNAKLNPNTTYAVVIEMTVRAYGWIRMIHTTSQHSSGNSGWSIANAPYNKDDYFYSLEPRTHPTPSPPPPPPPGVPTPAPTPTPGPLTPTATPIVLPTIPPPPPYPGDNLMWRLSGTGTQCSTQSMPSADILGIPQMTLRGRTFTGDGSHLPTPTPTQVPVHRTLLSNVQQESLDGDPLLVGYPQQITSGKLFHAVQFTTGRSWVTLTEVDLSLKSVGSEVAPRVRIYSSTDDGEPGSPLYVLAPQTSLKSDAINTFTAPEYPRLRLEANTTYHIVIDSSSIVRGVSKPTDH